MAVCVAFQGLFSICGENNIHTNPGERTFRRSLASFCQPALASLHGGNSSGAPVMDSAGSLSVVAVGLVRWAKITVGNVQNQHTVQSV